MKQLIAIFILIVVCTASAPAMSIGISKTYIESHALLKAIEGSTLVVVGEVIDTIGMVRNIQPSGSEKSVTTDVIVDVDIILKGEPNYGESKVIFMIEGGEYVHPDTGKLGRLWIPGVPEFSIGEHVLLFLTNRHSLFYSNYPNDGYRFFHQSYGKVEIEDDKVRLPYYVGDYESDMLSNITPFCNKAPSFDFRTVVLPIDLVVQLGLAFAVNPEATQVLENTIKDIARSKKRDTRVILAPETVRKLTSETERIIKKKDELLKQTMLQLFYRLIED